MIATIAHYDYSLYAKINNLMKPVRFKYFKEFLIIICPDYYSFTGSQNSLKSLRLLKLTMFSGYKYESFSHHRFREGALYGDWHCVRVI